MLKLLHHKLVQELSFLCDLESRFPLISPAEIDEVPIRLPEESFGKIDETTPEKPAP